MALVIVPWMVILILGLVALIGVPAPYRAGIVVALAALAASLRRDDDGDGMGRR